MSKVILKIMDEFFNLYDESKNQVEAQLQTPDILKDNQVEKISEILQSTIVEEVILSNLEVPYLDVEYKIIYKDQEWKASSDLDKKIKEIIKKGGNQ